ncbi:MAG: beta-propeller fold lactonase family protein [Gammaproteobacteria bacterium]|nr:beta-propeller fold lactonase family protein [Gammaproteobacteria bacterium]
MLRTRMSGIVFCLGTLLIGCGREKVPPSMPPQQAAAPAESRDVERVAAHEICVTNELSGDLSIFDGATLRLLATIPLGKRPRGVRGSPDGRLLFVALSGSPLAPPGIDERTLPPPDKSADGIGVFDLTSRRLERIVRGVSDPEQLAVGRDGGRLYVASEDTGTAVVLDVASGASLASVRVGGEPEGVAVSPDGSVAYVSSEEDHQVTVIATADHRVLKRFEVGLRPRAIAFAPDGTRAYVTGENDATVTEVDARIHAVTRTTKLAGENVRPMGVVVSADGRTVYVATGRGGTVAAIDAATFVPKGTVRVGARPWGIALSPDGRRLYTANGPSNDISVVDVGRFEVIATLPAGQRPWGVAALPR